MSQLRSTRRRRGGKKKPQPLPPYAVSSANIVELSMASETTSRQVQATLEEASSAAVSVLGAPLVQHFKYLARHRHGNHVIQQLIHVTASSRLTWLGTALGRGAQDLPGSVGQVLLTHAFGHRIWMRLIENAALEPTLQDVYDDIIVHAEEWILREYSWLVAESFLLHGKDKHARRIVTAIESQVLQATKHWQLLVTAIETNREPRAILRICDQLDQAGPTRHPCLDEAVSAYLLEFASSQS